jgi:hypothetical protein
MRFLVLAVTACLGSIPCLAGEAIMFPPDAVVAGHSQAEWSRIWWQWAGSFDESESPVADLSGSKCHLGQGGAVWFLAGTYGTHRTVRTCEVPRGKTLFFPLINYVVMPPREGRWTCQSAKQRVRELTDGPVALVLEIDGKQVSELERHRQATAACFDMAAGIRGGDPVFPAAANGYYVMLRPLPPGKHTLNFGGILSAMSQAVTYTLIVK